MFVTELVYYERNTKELLLIFTVVISF